MLYLIGLGLSDPSDITVKALETVRKCSRVFMDAYTSILTVGVDKLEEFLQVKIELADREVVEQGVDIVEAARNGDVAFLVVGDPLGATTHTDLILRAVESKVPYQVIHNASIMNAVGCCGLQLYNFGETVSIPLWDAVSHPESFLDKAEANLIRGLHTLCLLDIKVREQSVENLLRGRKIFEPPRFMTCAEAVEQILAIVVRRAKVAGEPREDDDQPCPLSKVSGSLLSVGLARVGSSSQRLLACPLDQWPRFGDRLGGPLHSLVLASRLHPVEEEMVRLWMPEELDADEICRVHARVVDQIMDKL